MTVATEIIETNAAEKVDSEGDTTAGAQAPDSKAPEAQASAIGGWVQYKRKLDRIDAAIQCSSAVNDNPVAHVDIPENELGHGKSVNVTFDGGQWYKIPWEACCTWQRMEVFLRTWLQDDDQGLADLDQGHYTLKDGDDLILPRLWEKLLTNRANINFSQTTPSVAETKSESSASSVASEEAPTFVKTEYETKLRYTVSYYRRSRFDSDDDEFEESSRYDEPLGFEVENPNEKLPALEETQAIIAPRYSSPRRKGGASGKIRLRPSDRIGKKTLKINSPFLLNVVRSVVTYSSAAPEDNDTGLTSGNFQYPFKDLCLFMDAMQNYRIETSGLYARHSEMFNQKYGEHLDLLRDYLDRQPGVMLAETRAKWVKPKPTTSFASVWQLLKPGSDVYVREHDGSLNAYVVDSVRGGVTTTSEGRRLSVPYQVQVWHLILGTRVIRAWTRVVDINVFDNDREIPTLPVFPVRFKDDVDGGVTKSSLIERGRKYFKYSRRPYFLQYSGVGLKAGKIYKRARVVVEHASEPWRDDIFDDMECTAHSPVEDDPFGLSIRLARCECDECKEALTVEDVHTMLFSDYRVIDPEHADGLTDHQYLLDVALLEDPTMAETAIDKLVMEPGNKDIIKAIAKIYTDEAPQGRFSADFISGKGEGQIILLHGPPGTGKTLTAESVAEYTKRPLLNITAADLGHEPAVLERNLLRYFRRAADWDAIVLLDEADVYLEQRSVEDLTRNSIVSVFLRAMDYFQGILFLTTNRVGQFDEAFASRIHLSLGYDKLDDKARGQIWDNLFQKLTEDHRKKMGPEIQFGISTKQYVKTKEVMALQWNGREIRNAFQTAVALAVYDAKQPDGGDVPYMTENHLEQVVAMSLAFKNYMKKTRQNMSESEWAAMKHNRYDSGTDRPGTTKGRRPVGLDTD
ncbi:hypothetical protein N0V91_009042 [Didymella pomorum]|uniref:AAA+ ATPase domain-containing protein n=1 Tax=Didymella pomorum TaxID=749634 RepID=A0A9W9D4T4_9PLEO|nr:hypothetical protein N0V91_009042 [Didymella pomorum]